MNYSFITSIIRQTLVLFHLLTILLTYLRTHLGAKIYGENVIRETQQGLNFLRLSSRIDAVASRLETAIRMQNVSKAMGTTVKGMSNVMKSMELENISKVMEEFEKQFENMDVKSKHMENTMQSSSATIAPPEMVENLMREVAAEAGLEFSDTLQPAPSKTTTLGTPVEQKNNKEVDDLELRLQALRK